MVTVSTNASWGSPSSRVNSRVPRRSGLDANAEVRLARERALEEPGELLGHLALQGRFVAPADGNPAEVGPTGADEPLTGTDRVGLAVGQVPGQAPQTEGVDLAVGAGERIDAALGEVGLPAVSPLQAIQFLEAEDGLVLLGPEAALQQPIVGVGEIELGIDRPAPGGQRGVGWDLVAAIEGPAGDQDEMACAAPPIGSALSPISRRWSRLLYCKAANTMACTTGWFWKWPAQCAASSAADRTGFSSTMSAHGSFRWATSAIAASATSACGRSAGVCTKTTSFSAVALWKYDAAAA